MNRNENQYLFLTKTSKTEIEKMKMEKCLERILKREGWEEQKRAILYIMRGLEATIKQYKIMEE